MKTDLEILTQNVEFTLSASGIDPAIQKDERGSFIVDRVLLSLIEDPHPLEYIRNKLPEIFKGLYGGEFEFRVYTGFDMNFGGDAITIEWRPAEGPNA